MNYIACVVDLLYELARGGSCFFVASSEGLRFTIGMYTMLLGLHGLVVKYIPKYMFILEFFCYYLMLWAQCICAQNVFDIRYMVLVC